MQPTVLDLNLATRPFRNNTWLWVSYGLALALVAFLTYWNVQTYTIHARDEEALRSRLENYESRMQSLRGRKIRAQRGIERHDVATLRVQAEKANDVIQLKAFSWSLLFDRLEEVLPYDVRMQSVRPIFKIGRRGRQAAEETGRGVPVTVEGTAKSLEAFFEFEGALLQNRFFDRVEPERHAFTESRELMFQLRFLYYPDGRPRGTSNDEVAETPAAPAGEVADLEEGEGAGDPEQPADTAPAGEV